MELPIVKMANIIQPQYGKLDLKTIPTPYRFEEDREGSYLSVLPILKQVAVVLLTVNFVYLPLK